MSWKIEPKTLQDRKEKTKQLLPIPKGVLHHEDSLGISVLQSPQAQDLWSIKVKEKQQKEASRC